MFLFPKITKASMPEGGLRIIFKLFYLPVFINEPHHQLSLGNMLDKLTYSCIRKYFSEVMLQLLLTLKLSAVKWAAEACVDEINNAYDKDYNSIRETFKINILW